MTPEGNRRKFDDVETAVKEYGFDLLKPPRRLRGPGALYQVEGNSFKKVCDVRGAMLPSWTSCSKRSRRRREVKSASKVRANSPEKLVLLYGIFNCRRYA